MNAGRLTIAVLLGALVGVALGVVLKGYLEAPPEAPATMADPAKVEADVMAYVHALQEDSWDVAIDRTWWMAERLSLAETDAARAEIRAELRSELRDRSAAGNRLTPEGIADQYVFRPEASVKVVGRDSGDPDLDPPAVGRVWLKVRFEDRSRAPLNEEGLPIRSLVVGLNVDAEGRVLLASVSGNLSVDKHSAVLPWNE